MRGARRNREYRNHNRNEEKRPISTSAVVRLVIWSAVLCILLGEYSAAMTFEGIGENMFGMKRGDDQYEIGNGTIDATVTDISIEWVSGSVKVVAYEGEEIRVTEDYDGEKDKLRLRWQVKGGRLLVKFCRTSVWGLDARSKNLTVEIPQSMADQLDRLKISSVSADQRVLVSARELEIHTVSGRADLQGQYNSVEIGTVSGDVSLDGIFCEGSIEGVSGDVDIRLREQAEELEMSFVSGKARVTLPETTTGFRVNFETVSGDSEIRGFDWDDDDSDRWGDGSMEISMNGVSGRLTIEKETKN